MCPTELRLGKVQKHVCPAKLRLGKIQKHKTTRLKCSCGRFVVLKNLNIRILQHELYSVVGLNYGRAVLRAHLKFSAT